MESAGQERLGPDASAAGYDTASESGRDISSALEAVAARFSAAAGWDLDRRADRSEWTTGQVLAHLIAVAEGYTEYARGRRTPIADVENLPAENLRLIDQVGVADGASMAARLQGAVAGFSEAVAARTPGELFYWHGHDLPVRTVEGILLGELLIHGLDAARAQGADWPIGSDDALAVIDGLLTVVPAFVTPAAAEVRATVRLRMRGGPAWRLRFDRGSLDVGSDGPGPVDWTISTDPAMFLLLSYGRIGQMRALVSGRVLGWGRRPAVGLRFNSFIAKP